MTIASPALRHDYDTALEAYLEGHEDDDLKQAAMLGRRALEEGAGLLAVILLHQEALGLVMEKARPSTRPDTVRRAMKFLAGCMEPFEEVQRRFRDAHDRLRDLNEEYESVVAERTREFRNAEVRFRSHVEQLPAVTYLESIRTRAPVYISPQVEATLGFTPRQWLEDPGRWAKQIHPEDCDRILVEMSRFREGGPPFQKEYRMIARDGREIWVRHEANRILDDAGRPQFTQGVLLEITDRKRAEFAARDIEARYEHLFANSVEALLLADAKDGRIRDANAAASTLLGIPLEELRAEKLSGLFPDDHARLGQHRRNRATDPEPPFVEVAVRFRDGSPRKVLVRASSARIGDDSCLLCILHPVPARRSSD